MLKVIKKDTYEDLSMAAFEVLKAVITANPHATLGLATGDSPLGLYREMVRDFKNNGTSYKNVRTFNLDEYVGLEKDHPASYWTFMHKNLFKYIDISSENVHIPSGLVDIEENCRAYEAALKKNIIDLQVLGIGSDGHIGFNEPGVSFDSETHITKLLEQTRKDNARFFDGDITRVPTHAITMGIASIMRTKKILLLATGKNKADAVYGMLKGEKTTSCPASILRDHPNVIVILDKEASTRI